MASDTDMFSYREDVQTIATIEKLARSTDETRSTVVRGLVKAGLEASTNITAIKKAMIIRSGVSRDIGDLYENCIVLGQIDENLVKIDAILTFLGRKKLLKIQKSEQIMLLKATINKLKLIKMADTAYFEQIRPVLVRHKKIEEIKALLCDLRAIAL